MTDAFKHMTELLACGAHGGCPESDKKYDVGKILEYAYEQNVMPLVLDSLEKSGACSDLRDKDEYAKKVSRCLAACQKGIQNRYFVYTLFKELEDNGIDFLVLKGDAFAVLYAAPELRVSSDTDILIHPADEERVFAILTGHGYEVKRRDEWSNEACARHRFYLPIDIHVSLYDQIRNDLFFDNAEISDFSMQTAERIVFKDYGTFATLDADEGLLFYFFHLVKHFLSEGIGVRMVMDLLLYIEKYKDKIDWKKFYERVQYRNFFDTVLGVGIEYLNCEKERLPECRYSKVLAEKLMDDIEGGGAFGYADTQRIGMKHIIAKKKYVQKSEGSFDDYAKQKYKVSVLRLIFPKIDDMCIKYPQLKEKKYLYLPLWIKRIFGFARRFCLGRVKLKRYTRGYDIEENDVINERVKLAEALKMI